MAAILSNTMCFSLGVDKSLWADLSLYGILPGCPGFKHVSWEEALSSRAVRQASRRALSWHHRWQPLRHVFLFIQAGWLIFLQMPAKMGRHAWQQIALPCPFCFYFSFHWLAGGEFLKRNLWQGGFLSRFMSEWHHLPLSPTSFQHHFQWHKLKWR